MGSAAFAPGDEELSSEGQIFWKCEGPEPSSLFTKIIANKMSPRGLDLSYLQHQGRSALGPRTET